MTTEPNNQPQPVFDHPEICYSCGVTVDSEADTTFSDEAGDHYWCEPCEAENQLIALRMAANTLRNVADLHECLTEKTDPGRGAEVFRKLFGPDVSPDVLFYAAELIEMDITARTPAETPAETETPVKDEGAAQ